MSHVLAVYEAAANLRAWYTRWFVDHDCAPLSRYYREEAEARVDRLLLDPATDALCDPAFVEALRQARHWETLFFAGDWSRHSKAEVVGNAKKYEARIDRFLAEREAGIVQGALF